MWSEPLIASTERVNSHTVAVTTRDASGVPVAAVLCSFNAGAACGSFGEMQILDDGAGPRQRERALVLLVREALRFADALGITRVHTEAPERLAGFASKLSGLDGMRVRGRRLYAGDLHSVRTATLLVSGDDGSLRDLPSIEVEETGP